MLALTSRQRAFVAEYLVDLNAAKAAARAGYSDKSAAKYGPQLLLHPLVAGAVRQAMAEREERMGITQDRVVEELARVAFGDLRELADWGPDGLHLKSSEALTEAQAASVCEVAEGAARGATGGGTLRIKRHDKLKALELLGKHLGMFKENRPQSGEDRGIIREFMEALQENGKTAEEGNSKKNAANIFDAAAASPGGIKRLLVRSVGAGKTERICPDEEGVFPNDAEAAADDVDTGEKGGLDEETDGGSEL